MNASTVASILSPLAVLLPSAAVAQSPSFGTENASGVFVAAPQGTSHAELPPATTVEFERRVETSDPFLAIASTSAHDQGNRVEVLGLAAANHPLQTVAVDVGTTAGGGATSGAQTWLWTLPGPRTGELALRSWSQVTAFAQGSIAIDIDADGTDEVVLSGSHFVPDLRLPVSRPGGLTVRITVFSRVLFATPAGERASLSTSIAFVDQSGVVPPYFGPIDGTWLECGARLTGADRPALGSHQLEFTLRDGLPGGQAWMLFGFQPLVPAPQLPGAPSCILELAPAVVVPRALDGTGQAVWSIAAPPPASGLTLFAQGVSLDATGTMTLTSNGLRTSFY